MEHKPNIDNFERFLRDKTDEFRMYPSKRVWYSIYNNMHPGNRMPSISMCIVLLFSLLTVGYLHTNTAKDPGVSKSVTLNQPAISSVTTKNAVNIADAAINNPGNHPYQKLLTLILPASPIAQIATTPGIDHSSIKQSESQSQYQSTASANTYLTKNNTVALDESNATTVASLVTSAIAFISHQDKKVDIGMISQTVEGVEKNSFGSVETDNEFAAQNTSLLIGVSSKTNVSAVEITQPATTENEKAATINAVNTKAVDDKKEVAKKEMNKSTVLSESDKAWIENYALYHRPAPKKWAGKVSWQAYFTPSVVYRTLHNNAAGKNLGNNTAYLNTDVNNLVNQKPSFGAEMGMALQYDVLKRIKIKAGLQLNYTRYNTHGFDNFHPITTSLAINSDNSSSVYEVSRTTPFSNAQGLQAVKLHNETYQVSVPVGLDLKLVSLDNIAWYVGATIQPTVVVYGRSYLISTDQRNYVSETSMLNRFNINAGFETYISFKTNNYTWQVGPQFRSQLFSTNSKTYSIEERLQNYGFKIGVSKKL